MGIKCLNNYVDKNQIKIPYRLQHTKLIIDGNILSKYLFYCFPSLKLKYFYGGDYTDLKAHVRVFFDKLTNCNVEPIVIFDGCSKMELEPSARLKRYQRNFAQRLRKVISICERGQVDDPVKKQPTPWPSVSTVLFEVMRELGVVHCQCVTREADDVISVLARYYQCPVLTMDSDFLLWDLPGGAISMFDLFEKYLNFSEPYSSIEYIECAIYYRENLLKHLESKYGFKGEMLPLVGPLLGYDHVDDLIANRFASHATQNQLNTLTVSFKTTIHSVLQRFASQFGSFRNIVIAKYFVQSTLDKLDSSIGRFVSVSTKELDNVVQGLVEQLDEISSKSSTDLELGKLNEIEGKIVGDLAQFEESVKKPTDSHNFRSWHYDRVPAVFRWLSSQSSFVKAKEKLRQFSLELKKKNLQKIEKNERFNKDPRFNQSFVFESTQFDHFMRHIKNEIPVSLLYERLEAKIHNLELDLSIQQFLDQMQNDLFPQEPEIPFLFHRNLTQGFTNPYLLNILYTKVDLYGALIEDYSTLTKSSYACRLDLDPYIYGIILNQDEEVTRINREGTKQVQVQIKPKFEINGRRLPNLEQICNIAESDRRDLLFTIIQQTCFTSEMKIDELIDKIKDTFPGQSVSVFDAFVLMILSLIMCTHKCHSQLTCSPKWNHFRRAMLLNIVAMGYIGQENSGVPIFIDLDREKIDLKQEPSTIDLTITHHFNSYHNCLQSLNFLTQLLNLYECFQLDRFVCGLQGSFVHAITTSLLNDESYYEIFLESMGVSEEIKQLFSIILGSL